MANIAEFTIHGFSLEETAWIIKSVARATTSNSIVRLVGPYKISVPENISVEYLDQTAKWRAVAAYQKGNDAYSQLLKEKEVIPKRGGVCSLKIGGDPASLSLTMYLLNHLINRTAFDEMIVMSSQPAALLGLIKGCSGSDKEPIEDAINSKRFVIVDDVLQTVALMLDWHARNYRDE